MKWLMHMSPHGGPTHGYLKCYAYEEFRVNSPWGLGEGCKSMPKLPIHGHEKIDDHAICGN